MSGLVTHRSGLAAVVVRPTTAHCLLGYLGLFDLPHFQATCTDSSLALAGADLWHGCLVREQPKLEIDPKLLEPECRRAILTAMPGIYRSAVSGPVEIKSAEEAQRLSKQLEIAERTAASHMAVGGKVAHVVVARPRFSGSMLDTALDKTLPGKKSGGYKAMCFASPFRCPPVPPANPSAAESAEAPATAVSIQFVWRNGSLLIGAWEEDDASSAEEQEDEGDEEDDDSLDEPMPVFRLLAMDVLSASPELLLQYRGVGITLNGPLNKAQSGVYNPTRGKEAAIEALSNGLLCVLCLRDRLPKRPCNDFLTNALNFDSTNSWRTVSGM
ncbi:unnamed protein product [Polarella glacialis]|uniref:Uncharacterized protein n=1 Tax=Polarella glacialis TaxID=89957 RepID=A0A813G825_POLGL|nr:unnamed protein product [Polarella glacialis]